MITHFIREEFIETVQGPRITGVEQRDNLNQQWGIVRLTDGAVLTGDCAGESPGIYQFGMCRPPGPVVEVCAWIVAV